MKWNKRRAMEVACGPLVHDAKTDSMPPQSKSIAGITPSHGKKVCYFKTSYRILPAVRRWEGQNLQYNQ